MSGLQRERSSSGSAKFEKAQDGLDNATDSEPQEESSRHLNDEELGVKELARQYTLESTMSSGVVNPFEAQPGSKLDPNSDNFVPKAYVKALFNLEQRSDGVMNRTAGVAFRNLSAYGFGTATDYQRNVGSIATEAISGIKSLFVMGGPRRIDILRNFDGLVKAGEMLIVLGPPGSGCSTFLKTIAGETYGYQISDETSINYQGIGFQQMHSDFRGEAVYTAEQDVHYPNLTVGDTLYFAARTRVPRTIPGGVSVSTFATHLRDVAMATFGIRHTINTKVGNDFIRGVSGGERKRVSIAEAALSRAPLQCWDNSTRGLDSANAVEFCKTLRIQADLFKMVPAVAIYQAPQAAYDLFDKAIVLYEGREIYFGRADAAKEYFVKMGFHCPERQTTADFLTSMTSPHERIIRPGFEDKTPRSCEEFEAAWKNGPEYKGLLAEIAQYEEEHPMNSEDLENFQQSRRLQQSKFQRHSSPFTLSYAEQIRLCLWRGFRRLEADSSLTLTQLFGNFIMALIVGSVFYNLDDSTGSFFSRGTLLFFALVMNALSSLLEILTLYAQRGIIEKHRFALYHPSAEAVASILTDLPYKTLNTITLNTTLYFMSNLRRGPGNFFFFLLIMFFLTLVMSGLFRTIASITRSLEQALAPGSVFVIGIIVYTGYVIPPSYMLGWSSWIKYINPLSYGFESLMVNEFSGRSFRCSPTQLTPIYGQIENAICSVIGSVQGELFVNGDNYINSDFEYYVSHRWRNVGILIVFLVGLTGIYLLATELISSKKSKGEVLVFQRGRTPLWAKTTSEDTEAAPTGTSTPTLKEGKHEDLSAVIQKQTSIFQWHDICYDIKIKGQPRRILDNVDGWVKPGTLTALMGVSGAGKTTLLDVLASRVSMGVISGEMLVDGRQRDKSFQRKTGYVQQQDLHLSTSTVREVLDFSALLRQPAHIPRQEKLDYVTEVIKLLEMEEYADAVVGIPGEGLNVEQRKRLTIGVELVAKPELLLFLDEPTSGLDSQTSWSILNLLENLTNNGQAILCTIHQPSAMLFQRFDRLLFLARGGRTVYFGNIGESSKTLIEYFVKNGAHPCPPDANPAEWMLEVIGAAPGSHSEIDWPVVWRNSPELQEVHREIEQIKKTGELKSITTDKSSFHEFATSFPVQYAEVQKRVFQQYWHTPSYIYSKLLLCVAPSLFIGFSFFRASNTQQGLQNQMFSIFELMTLIPQLTQQIMPLFVMQRDLFEVRERPGKTYSWLSFLLSNIVVEATWGILCAILLYVCWYYPVGLWRNAEPTDTVHERGFLTFLLLLALMLFTSTFAHMVVASISNIDTAGNISNLLFILNLIFCGVLASPKTFARFWIFMFRISPLHYLVHGLLSTAVKDTSVTCADNEYLHFNPPTGQSCGVYMERQINEFGGYLQNPNSTSDCSFCPLNSTNQFLEMFSVTPSQSWMDFGLLWVYIGFNICGCFLVYWAFRVPKKPRTAKKSE